MKKILSTSIVGAATLATSVGIILAGSGAAQAATVPPWQNSTTSPNATQTLSLFNADGTPKTTGSINDSPIAAYYESSGTLVSGDNKAGMFVFTASSTSLPDNWNGDGPLGTFTSYPVTTGPADITSATTPVSTGAAGDDSIAVANSGDGTSTADPNTAYQNVYELRLKTSGHAGSLQSTNYAVMDIKVDPTTGIWTQIYPTPPAAPSITAITPSVASPAAHGTSVTFSATLSESDGSAIPAGGSVHLFDGTTDDGAATLNTTTGAISDTLVPADGDHTFTFKYTPASGTGATSPVLNYHVNLNIPTPTVTLAVGGSNTTAGADTTLTATVTSGSPAAPLGAGTVAFYDNNSTTALPGTVTQNPTGTFTLDLPTGFAAGSHSVVAKFTPTDPAAYNSASSAPQAFQTQTAQVGACLQTGSVCTDVQNIQATIPVGTLIINTPYTAAAPLDLGTLALQPGATEYKGTGTFSNIIVVDTRAGNLPYTISALSSDLSDGGSNPGSKIDSQNVGLTGLNYTGSGGFNGAVTKVDNPAAEPPALPGAALGAPGQQGLGINPHTVISVDHGIGTMNANGTLTITAPTSTEAGLFTGTITFTVG